MQSIMRARHHAQHLQTVYPWTKIPLVVGAPMRVLSGPQLAVKVSEAGGLGFIGPGTNPEQLAGTLKEAKEIMKTSKLEPHFVSDHESDLLPIGVGFQTWAGDLVVATTALSETRVSAVWLFAPRQGQAELDTWTREIRQSSPGTQIWIQVASVKDALAAASSQHRPDVLVVQGSDAGGHSLKQGAGIITLLPEITDSLAETLSSKVATELPLIAAGGISDSRGAAAAFTLGASGVALGTRLLATNEASINPGYQSHILAASDGGQTTVRTQLYNHLRGTTDWPEPFDARGLINASWRDHEGGMPFNENKQLHDVAIGTGSAAWGEERGRTATYAGTGVGLIRNVRSAEEIVTDVREGIGGALGRAIQLTQ